MARYIFRRILAIIPVVFIVTFIVFILVYLTPGGPAASILGMEASQAQIDALNEQLGYNRNVFVQYFDWLSGILRGDLGESYFMTVNVNQAIKDHMVPTIQLAVFAEIIAIVLGFSLGIIAVLNRGTFIDWIISSFNLIGQAVPSFVISLILMIVFSIIYRVFPASGYQPLSSGIENHLRFMALPALAIGIGQASIIARMTRSELLANMNEPYVMTGEMKGLSQFKILSVHVLKNTLMPILTIVGQSFGSLIAGSIVVETIFGIPGLGQLLINSINRRDFAVIQGVVLVISLTYVVINLIVDLLYTVVDPRISSGKAES